MRNGMKLVRSTYRVPAYRGQRVRDKYMESEGTITSSDGMHLRVRFDNGSTAKYHPFDLDYQIDGDWMTGDWLKHLYDDRIDRQNKRWNNAR